MQLYLSSMTGESDEKRRLKVNSKLASIFNAVYEVSGSTYNFQEKKQDTARKMTRK